MAFFLTENVLSAYYSNEARKLSRIIRETTNMYHKENSGIGIAVSVSRPSGLRPYSILVSKLQGISFGPNHKSPGAVVFISDPEMGHDFPAEYAASFYGLTLAEAELLCSLINGMSLEEIACDRETSINTVRWQLKNIYRKTNTRRQSDLVRLILSSPAALMPPYTG